eukprot:scaffold1974_cov395-Prasinococcus_capsulatus_cf.AAC.12
MCPATGEAVLTGVHIWAGGPTPVRLELCSSRNVLSPVQNTCRTPRAAGLMMKVEATAGPRPTVALSACRRRLLKPRDVTNRLPLVTIVSWALLLLPTRPVEADPFAMKCPPAHSKPVQWNNNELTQGSHSGTSKQDILKDIQQQYTFARSPHHK